MKDKCPLCHYKHCRFPNDSSCMQRQLAQRDEAAERFERVCDGCGGVVSGKDDFPCPKCGEVKGKLLCVAFLEQRERVEELELEIVRLATAILEAPGKDEYDALGRGRDWWRNHYWDTKDRYPELAEGINKKNCVNEQVQRLVRAKQDVKAAETAIAAAAAQADAKEKAKGSPLRCDAVTLGDTAVSRPGDCYPKAAGRRDPLREAHDRHCKGAAAAQSDASVKENVT